MMLRTVLLVLTLMLGATWVLADDAPAAKEVTNAPEVSLPASAYSSSGYNNAEMTKSYKKKKKKKKKNHHKKASKKHRKKKHNPWD